MASATRRYAAVMAGGGLGSIIRYGLSLLMLQGGAWGFPWGTLTANVLGSFAIGLFATLTGPDGRALVSSTTRSFVMIGFCGGLTTFSVFSVETVLLVEESRFAAAAVYVGASLLLWALGVWGGHAVAQRVNRLQAPKQLRTP